jgi:hypothetical protein
MDANIIAPIAIFLASEEANAITGCRYIGKNWRDDLPLAEATEAAREPAIFLPPERDALLIKTWEAPAIL